MINTFLIRNFFEKGPRFVLKDGLPVTTKKEKAFHGYGTKSMERIVNKYNATLSITNESGVFTLVALFFELFR